MLSFTSLSVLALMALSASVDATPTSVLVRRDHEGIKAPSVCNAAMCVDAVKNGTNVEYTLSSKSTTAPGWMAVGFGTAMGNAPMVVLWSNTDGSVTLSQRSAPGFVMPTVNPSPRSLATLTPSASVTTGTHKYVFSVAFPETSTSQSIIYASGSTNPGSTDAGAVITKHSATGKGSLNFSNSTTNGTAGGAGNSAVGVAALTTRDRVMAMSVLLAAVVTYLL